MSRRNLRWPHTRFNLDPSEREHAATEVTCCVIECLPLGVDVGRSDLPQQHHKRRHLEAI